MCINIVASTLLTNGSCQNILKVYPAKNRLTVDLLNIYLI